VPEHDGELGAEAGRPLWSGTVTFGLVSVPVNILPANRPKRVSLRMVTEDGTPLRRRYFTSKDDKPLDWDDIIRGYEVEKGKYVALEDDELERLAPEKSRDIDLQQFVNAEEINPRFFERAYFLTPAGGSNKAYRLLAQAMEETGLAGIATFVMRSKEYLTAILAENGILRAETLRFADEIRDPESVGLPKAARPKPAEVKKLLTQMRKLNESTVSTTELKDPTAERMLKLVKTKKKKGEDVVELPEDDEESSGVIDLLEVLQRRLAESKREGGGEGGRKSARKRSGARKRSAAKRGASKSAKRSNRGRKSAAG
jgi:DNA end-binding protein Ku